jgi:hypothetical protein
MADTAVHEVDRVTAGWRGGVRNALGLVAAPTGSRRDRHGPARRQAGTEVDPGGAADCRCCGPLRVDPLVRLLG